MCPCAWLIVEVSKDRRSGMIRHIEWLDEETILKAQAGDAEAREKVIENFEPLIESIASSYFNSIHMDSAVGREDLVQEGYFGLLNAMDTFDYSKGRNYKNYFEYAIRTAMRLELSNNSRAIRIPRFMLDRIRKIESTISELKEEGEDTCIGNIARRTGLKEKDVKTALDAYGHQNILSLDMKAYDDDDESSLSDFIECREIVGYEDRILLEKLDKAIEALPEEERSIIEALYGFSGKPVSVNKLAGRFGESRTKMNNRIRGIHQGLAAAI